MSCVRLADAMSGARLERAVLWAGLEAGMWVEEGALLVLRLRAAGDSDFGVEAAGEVSRATELLTPFRPFMTGPGASLL